MSNLHLITIEDLKLYALNRAIEIWKNRSEEIEDTRDCPLCAMSSLLNTDRINDDNCQLCFLFTEDPIGGGCFNTPYDKYNSYYVEESHANPEDKELYDEKIKSLQAAKDFHDMLLAYKNGDMEKFKSYYKKN